MALILGGTPSSKLFANVREKMSLCYYCAANYIETKQTMLVDCGIETENIEKTKTAIAAQLDALRSGEIAEEELESALMTIHNTMQGVGDTPSSYVSWYLGQLCRGTALTPTEEEQAYRKVTTAQIMEAAKSMQLDKILLLTKNSLLSEMEAGRLKTVPLHVVFLTFYGLLTFPLISKNLVINLFLEDESQFESFLREWKQYIILHLHNLLCND